MITWPDHAAALQAAWREYEDAGRDAERVFDAIVKLVQAAAEAYPVYLEERRRNGNLR